LHKQAKGLYIQAMKAFPPATHYDHGLRWEHPLRVQVMHSRPQAGVSRRPDMHFALHMGVVLEGGMALTYPGRASFIAEEGQVWFTACWEPHVGVPTAETTILLFTVLLDALGKVAPFADVPWEAPFLCPCSARPQAATSKLRRETLCRSQAIERLAMREEEDAAIATWLRFHELLLPFARMPHGVNVKGSSGLSRVRPALDLVRKAHQVVTVDAAAQRCGLGRRRFCQLFRESFGVSFGRFALRARLAGAATDLRSSDEPVKQVAATWGFYDPSHFHRSFVAHFGAKPSDFRHDY
jgi:AraC-like DNA-binding protein